MALISPYNTTRSALHKQEWSDMHEFGFEASFTSQNNWKIRLFPKPVAKIAITSWLEIRASNASLCSEFSGNVANIPAVLQPSSTCQWFQLLTVVVNISRINQSYFCVVKPTHISLALAVRTVSLFVLGCCPHFSHLAVLPLDAQCSLMRVANWRKKRDCSQSTTPGKREALPE